jgi:dimethylargininase
MLGSLVSVYFLFWLFVTAAAPLLGPVVWRAVIGSRHMEGPVLFVRLPASTLAEAGPVPATAPATAPVRDTDAVDAESDEQWDALVGALTETGAATVEVPVADRAPASVFLHDVVIVMGKTAILAAGESRHGELPDLEMRLRGYPVAIEHVDPSAVLSGEDVLVAGSNVYVAVGEHTDAAGVRELRRIAGAHGYTVIALTHVTGRLTDAATALPDGTVLADVARLGESARLIPALRPSLEASGASVLVPQDDTVLVSDAAPRTRAMLEELGFIVVPVDVSAFESLGGSLGRMAVRLG